MNGLPRKSEMHQMRRVIPVLCAALLMWIVACGDESESEQNQNDNQASNQEPVEEPPEDPLELCKAACGRIYADDEEGCDTLFVQEGGGAMLESECVDMCFDDGIFRGGEWCIATEAECRDDPMEMIEPCLPDDYHHPHCSEMGLLPLEWEELEVRAVELINEHRTNGLQCPGGMMEPVEEVQMDETLRCAARLHSKDMVDSGYFSTTNPETGENTRDRIEAAGYDPDQVGGVVVSGDLTAEQYLQTLVGDAEHCETIMNGDFEDIGVGRYEFERWTLKMANRAN